MHLAKLLVWLLPVSGLQAAVITLGDNDFQNANWSTTVLGGTAGVAASGTRVATGGNPDAYRQTTITLPLTGPSAQALINFASFSGLATYNPSVSGAITQLQIDYDLLLESISGLPLAGAAVYRPLIRQGGQIYFLAVGDGATGGWTGFSHTSLSNLDWTEINNGLSRPDFTATGGTIEFGFRALLTITCGPGASCGPVTTVSGLDNFQITVTNTEASVVPEPGTLLITAVFGSLLLIRGRRYLRR